MLEYLGLPAIRFFEKDLAPFMTDAHWYFHEVQEAFDERVIYSTEQEIVRSVSCGLQQAVILRDGSIHVNWGDGVWVAYPRDSRGICVNLQPFTAQLSYADGSQVVFFSPTELPPAPLNSRLGALRGLYL